MQEKDKFLVTSALPYANGPLHIGHIAGAYLPADIFVKYHRQNKNNIVYICGTDEYGVPIVIQAEKRGISPSELVIENHSKIKESFARLDINFDYFSGTSSEDHSKLAQSFFINLDNNKYIETKEENQFFCNKDKMFLPDRYIIGKCPNCNADNSRGDECNRCNAWIDSDKIKDPKCKLCGSTPNLKTTKHWYFYLQKLENNLYNYIENNVKLSKNVKEYSLNWLRKGLHERAITRDLSWGVDVPKENVEDKVLYVWFDAPIAYISITKQWAKHVKNNENLWKEYWLNKKSKIIHFIGKDNIPFHSLFFPAILMGQENGYNLPYNIIANEHLTIEGKKLSTSSGNVLWVDDFLKIFPSDYLRYYLISISPENKDSNFSWKHFQEKINSELNNSYGNFVNRTLSFIDRYLAKNIPIPGELKKEDKEYLDLIKLYPKKVAKLIEGYRFKDALYKCLEISDLGNKYFEFSKPWLFIKSDLKRSETIVYCALMGVYISAYLFYCFIPNISDRVWDMIGEEKKIQDIDWASISDKEINSIKIKKVTVIINKIEDKIVDDLINKTYNKQVDDGLEKNSVKKDYALENSISEISIDDFLLMDIRVANVLKCEKIAKSKKLLKFQLDLGQEKRQIISGIAESYSPEELIGRQVLVITNLPPRKLMGEMSQGMILAAQQENNKITLISPNENITKGSKVS